MIQSCIMCMSVCSKFISNYSSDLAALFGVSFPLMNLGYTTPYDICLLFISDFTHNGWDKQEAQDSYGV
jgi:hypothetical protein